MNEVETVEVIAIASALFPSLHVPTNGMTLDVWTSTWHRQLTDIPRDVAVAVLEAAAAGEDRDFAPAPGQIRLRALAVMSPSGSAPPADEAWGEVRNQIHRVGFMEYEADVAPRHVEFSHPAIAAVVIGIGWEALCLSENEIADRAHFIRLYEQRTKAMIADAAIPPGARAVFDSVRPADGREGYPLERGRVRLDRRTADPIVIGQAAPSMRLLDKVRQMRRELPPGEAVDEHEPHTIRWQEGDPIDLDARGIRPADPQPVDQPVEAQDGGGQ